MVTLGSSTSEPNAGASHSTCGLIREAPDHLLSGGQLVIVANAFLSYSDLLERDFGGFEVLADDRRFRDYHGPRKGKAAGRTGCQVLVKGSRGD